MTVLTIVIIPVTVSVLAVIGYLFPMTLRPWWSSTNFGPYFVAAAMRSGAYCVTETR